MVPDLDDMIDSLEHALEGLVSLDYYVQRWADLGSDDPDDTTSISAAVADVEKEKRSGRWYIVGARGYLDAAREAVADGEYLAAWTALAVGWKMQSEALQIAREGRNPLDQVPQVGRPRNNERNEMMYLAAKDEMERDPGKKLTIAQSCKQQDRRPAVQGCEHEGHDESLREGSGVKFPRKYKTAFSGGESWSSWVASVNNGGARDARDRDPGRNPGTRLDPRP